MYKREIKDRNDVSFLVRSFYKEIRKDHMLAPIFNFMIKEEHWEHHFEVLTDFWESNLLRVQKYSGRPDSLHIWVDMQTGRRISQLHFDRWLEIWRSTVTKHFSGEVSNNAMNRAEMIGKTLFDKMKKVRIEAEKQRGY